MLNEAVVKCEVFKQKHDTREENVIYGIFYFLDIHVKERIL